jgi:hypothetical protein
MNMQTNLSILVEVSAGTDIETAAEECMRLANKLNVIVDFKFNGVTCMAIPGGDYKNIPINYFEAQESKSVYKLASSHKR